MEPSFNHSYEAVANLVGYLRLQHLCQLFHQVLTELDLKYAVMTDRFMVSAGYLWMRSR